MADFKRDYKIIAVDFDGTLSLGQWPEIGTPNLELFQWLKRESAMGSRIILWTCRAGEQLRQAVEWCRNLGLVFDAVNDNLPEIVELYGNNSRKITADYYIDDRAVPVWESEVFRGQSA